MIGAVNAQPSSKDVERYQAELTRQAEFHNQIVSGVQDCANGLNGFVDTVADHLGDTPLAQAVNGPLNQLVEGLGKILQSISDIHSTQADGLSAQAANLTPVIEELRTHESGIVIPELRRKN